jgi:hypothetical protein
MQLQRRLDSRQDVCGILVFPASNNLPSTTGQSRVYDAIARDVAAEFWQPESCVALGKRSVNRTLVPKASVYEHRDFPLQERKIGTHHDTPFAHAEVLPKPQSTPVNVRAQS